MLARRSTPAEYGAFAVAFAAFLFLGGFHQALFLEPMSVLGARRDASEVDAYLSRLVRLHFVLTLPASAVLAAGLLAPGLDRGSALAPVLGLAGGLPLILLLWLARAACYLKGRPGAALTASAVYAGCLAIALAGRIALAPERSLGSVDAFAVMAGASLVSAIVGWFVLGLRWTAERDLPSLLREHWSYGRFILAASVAHGVSTLALAPLLALLSDLAQTGAYRALQNLATPFQQALAAGTLLALPHLSRLEAHAPRETFRRGGRLLLRWSVAASAAYAAALVALGPWCLRLLYGESVYSGLGWALLPLALALAFAGPAQALGIVVRAGRRPDAVMWSKLAAALTVVAAGVFAIRAFGLAGALYALLASAVAETCVLVAASQRLASNTPTSSGSMTAP